MPWNPGFLHFGDSVTFEAIYHVYMNLVIDSGNSTTKVGIFDGEKLVDKRSFPSIEQLREFIQTGEFENILISSVNLDPHTVATWANRTSQTLILDKHTRLPVKNLYKTPETLGMDRLAGVCGAVQLFPGFNSLVIDVGTCVTYDFVDRQLQFHGGGISPGLNMRFEAVHTFTARLPLVSPVAGAKLVGDTTAACIQSGVGNGMVAEIDGVIRQYKEKFPDLQAILCGGDVGFFENQLKASIFAIPDLVLIGLNSILIHNVNPT